MLVQNNARKGMKVQKLTLKYQHYVLASFVLNLALFLQNSHHKSPVRLYLEQTCKELQTLIKYILQPTQKNGEGGIRTPGTLLRYTVFPGLHLKPLGHFSSVLYSSLSSNQNRSISNILSYKLKLLF